MKLPTGFDTAKKYTTKSRCGGDRAGRTKKMTFNTTIIENIINEPSPHLYSRQGQFPDMICCHQTGDTMERTRFWFKDPDSGIAAHFGIAKDGTIYRFLPVMAAGCICKTTYKSEDRYHSNYYSKSSNTLVRNRRTNADFYTVSVIFENERTCQLTQEQYNSGIELFRYLICLCRKEYGVEFPIDREHIIGHYEVSPVEKANCPGLDFPFSRFIFDLQTYDRNSTWGAKKA